MRSGRLWGMLIVLFFCAPVSRAIDMDRLRVQRKEIFEFTRKPSVTMDGDNVRIAFAVKDFCDATVAIEDNRGRILRHLAGGVLGKNAALPFQKDSLKQTLVWDGKDEVGRYIDDRDSLTVRVSLGLKAQMERTLYWSGQKMTAGSKSMSNPLIKAAPEGVYVWYGGGVPQLRLFDHDGKYIRTLYPFPRKEIESVRGLKWQEYPPDNERLPSKLLNHDQDTFLPDDAVRSLAADSKRIWLLGSRLTPIGKDGSSGDRNLYGASVCYTQKQGKAEYILRPHSAAISPDGKRLYATGYSRMWRPRGYPTRRSLLHRVFVIGTEDGAELRPFVAVDNEPGTDNTHFSHPMGIACDAEGRVYVADTGNDRIQVYRPDGSHIKSIAFKRPGIVAIHPRTGEIWVVTSNLPLHNQKEPLKWARLGPLSDPTVKAAWPIPSPGFSYQRCQSYYDVYAEIDFATEPPTLWTSLAPAVHGAPHERCNIKLYRPDGRKLVGVRSFAADAREAIVRSRPPHFGRPRLWVHPKEGTVYLGLITWDTAVACKSFR